MQAQLPAYPSAVLSQAQEVKLAGSGLQRRRDQWCYLFYGECHRYWNGQRIGGLVGENFGNITATNLGDIFMLMAQYSHLVRAGH